MLCSVCNKPVATDSLFCSNCGQSVTGSAGANAIALPPNIETMLAEANLHRMRGEWNDAESRCIEVLRRDPNCVHAHSLLGDIFRDQNRLDESAQWYQLSLDLDPESSPDRQKLADVEKLRLRRQARANPAGATAGASAGTQRLMGLRPTHWTYGIVGLIVTAFVVAIALTIAVRTPRSSMDASRGTVQGGTGTAMRADIAQGLPLPIPMVSPFAATAQNKQGQQGTEPAQGDSTIIGGQQTTPRAAGAAPTTDLSHHDAASALPTMMLPSELEVQKNLQGLRSIASTTAVTGVTTDPRTQRTTVVLTHTTQQTTPAALRAELMVVAWQAARTALRTDSNSQTASVELRVQAGSEIAPAFAADLDRTAAAQIPDPATLDQINAAFTSIWWNPAISPDSGTNAQGSGPAGGTTAQTATPQSPSGNTP